MCSHPSPGLHPHTQCLPHLASFFSSSFPLYITSLSFFLLFLPVCLSIPFFLSLSFSDRQQRQWFGVVNGASPARRAGSAAGSDQVHQEGASVSLSGLQECTSGCWDDPNHSATVIMLNIDMNYSIISLFFYLSWEGVPQWDGWWGDVQVHLFSVLSPRRLVKTISPLRTLPPFCRKTKMYYPRQSNIINTPPNSPSSFSLALLQNTAQQIYDPDSLNPQMQPHTLTSCSTHLT